MLAKIAEGTAGGPGECALLDDERRGFPAYNALQNRIWDDVRDSSRQNPYAPMVRLSAAEDSR